jgi:putative ABC transport system permease protein
MESVWQDLRYAGWRLLKNPGFTLVVVLTLALGIGMNTAIFSVVNFVLLRPLDFGQPDQLVMIWERNLKKSWSESPTSFANFRDFRDNAKLVEIASFTDTNFNLTGSEQSERVAGLRVSANTFSILGVSPLHGRVFSLDEDKPGSGRVLILSYGLWQRSLGGRTSVIDQPIQLDGQSYTVIGVMPPDFKFPPAFSAKTTEEMIKNADLWVPLTTDDVPLVRNIRNLKMIGRLKPGVTPQQAQAEINAIASQLDKQFPDFNAGIDSLVIPLHEQVVGDVRQSLLILLAAVTLVLLIACANIVNVLLAKATARQKEIAIRTALGASPLRLLRQLLTESVLLGLVGGLFGLMIAYAGTKILGSVASLNIPQLKDLSFDVKVLLFGLATSLLTSLIFGLAPATAALKLNLNESLKEGGRSSSGAATRARLRNALVIAEIALAVVLVTAAGLMLRSFIRLQSQSPGLDPKNLITLEIELADVRYHDAQQQMLFQQRLLQRVASLPGVQYAATVDNLPFSGNSFNTSFTIEGRPTGPTMETPRAYYRVISPNYFQAIGIKPPRGNQFTNRDTAEQPGVAIINETAAQRYWPGADPIGKRIKRGRLESKNPWVTITGIVSVSKQNSLKEGSQPEIYVPYLQNPGLNFTLVARTTPEPKTLAGALRGEVRAADPEIPVTNLKLMEELISNSVNKERFNVLLLGVFAALALILAAVGVYGVLSYSVTLRTHDIGVRMALGAMPIDIFKHVLGQALLWAGIGLAIGILIAIGSTRVMSSLLYGISASDPLTLVATSLVLLVMALLASYIPARRATKVDPIITLRHE